jgi:hypothetical protein
MLMKKVFMSIFLVSLFFNFTNAEEVNKTTEKAENDSSKKLFKLQERLKKFNKG